VKVALITGRCPPGGCGVGDYTACLDRSLKASGVESHLITSGNWSLGGVFEVNRNLREQNFDIVHIEYPTVGFGHHLGPQGLSLLRKSIVTIHEVSQRRILRKLSLLPFTVRPAHIVFTSTYERRFATTWTPWISSASSVIPVGSNIPASTSMRGRSLDEIVYFGLIMPHKGLERVVELSQLIKLAGLSLRVRVIGTTPPRYAEYLERLRSDSAQLPIIWDLDLNETRIAERLGEAAIAYLPYPDGASERRTTLKAALLNGVAVVTTRSPQTPHNLEQVVKFCSTANAALAVIRRLIDDIEELARMAREAVNYAKAYSWERIAEQHVCVYQSVLSQRKSPRWTHRDRPKTEAFAPASDANRKPLET
jgi:glycosyltransferase involved in cell wall biosynthesis